EVVVVLGRQAAHHHAGAGRHVVAHVLALGAAVEVVEVDTRQLPGQWQPAARPAVLDLHPDRDAAAGVAGAAPGADALEQVGAVVRDGAVARGPRAAVVLVERDDPQGYAAGQAADPEQAPVGDVVG